MNIHMCYTYTHCIFCVNVIYMQLCVCTYTHVLLHVLLPGTYARTFQRHIYNAK